jgi:hypothetical protein
MKRTAENHAPITIGPVETGIPRSTSRPGSLTAAIETLAVGESILVGNCPGYVITTVSTYVRKKNPGRKFSRRSAEGGVRVWRLA